ncbi:MAG: ABC transporter ATP-binding protein [Christensenellales bacterium]
MISLRGVSKVYEGLPAVREVDLEVPDGELCVLLGPSGCGKSTLLKLINALVAPTAGDILIEGRNIRGIRPEILRRGIGYVVQSVGLFPHYTVGRNIAVVMKLLGRPQAEIDRRVGFLLDLIGLPGRYAGRYPGELSGGEAQRVGVARALAADPAILLMDEPFGSVDPLNRERLQKSFIDIQKTLRKTVLFVTHDVSEALMLADRILLMKEGRIVREGTPEALVFQAGDAFSQAFFGSETALKLLSRYQAGQACVPAAAAGRGQWPPQCSVNAELPLATALSLMIREGCRELLVQGEAGPLGILSFDSLLHCFRAGAPDVP